MIYSWQFARRLPSSLLVATMTCSSIACGDREAPQRPGFSSAARAPEFNRMVLLGSGGDGGTIELTVRAQDIPDLFAGGFTLAYDPLMLELVSAVPASELRVAATSFANDSFVAGELMVGFVMPAPAQEGAIVEVTFAPRSAGVSAVEFAEPAHPWVEERKLMDERGYLRRGVRWFGGLVDARSWEAGQ